MTLDLDLWVTLDLRVTLDLFMTLDKDLMPYMQVKGFMPQRQREI